MNGHDGSTPRCLPCEAARGAADPGAFSDDVTRVVRAHRAQLARVAQREGLSPEDAFDTVQEAFCALLRRPDAAQLVAAADGSRKLLVTMTRNLARNRRRLHAGARPHSSDAALLDGLPDGAAAPDDRLAVAEESRRLAACVARLGEVQRSVVTLRMLEELPGDDVGRLLGIDPGYVAVLLHRAKASLLACMTAGEPHTDPDTDIRERTLS
jgi:RNA polymerase sigma-70 factor (ECF subfamily)